MGQNIVGLCHVLFLVMENIIPAEAAQHFLQKDVKKLQDYLRRITLQIGAVVLILLGLMTIATPNIVHWINGASHVPYTYVVWGFCLLYIFVFLSYPFRYFFRTLHFTKPIFIAYCWSAFLSILLAIPLVQNWQIIGVLIGLILSQVTTLIVYGYYYKIKVSSVNNSLCFSTITNK